MNERLDTLLEAGHPDHPALTYQDKTLSYRQLREQTRSAAAGFAAAGLRRGDRVVVQLEKRLETVIAMLAVSAAGGVIVPVNPVARPAQLAAVVNDCAATFLVTSDRRYASAQRELDQLGCLERIVRVGAGGEWEHLVDADPQAAPELAVIDADLAAIFYTSGSTGGPKGVVLTHRNLIAGAQSVAKYLGHTCDDVILAVLPLGFDAGFSQLTTAFVAGAHVVLVNYVTPREVVKLCARHRVTALTCVPPLWRQLVDAPWPTEAGQTLRYVASTGGPVPRPLLDRLRALFPAAKPFLMYGLTEAFRSTYLDPAELDRRPDSVGKAIPNAEVLVVRPDGSLCAADEIGEVVHRGALVAQGYWNDPGRSAERFRPWPPGGLGPVRPAPAVWSGDLARRDADGFLYLVGRNDEMIKTSGYRVSPTEIEDVAYASGLVSEAVAFGRPDERLGQQIVLVVAGIEGRPCEPDVLRKALAHELPAYMVPQQVVVLEQLPRTPNGKFDRAGLRRQVTA
jgi:acyl-CoA ligase (AMP-forming) (exosortase A-associated)